ncbi:MAG TPA: RHS repeat-associated core domain-containing protein, partial [Ktedonobacteraceae bacterium]|nr:RHS repeat-associated core domain-containing protein [Ktedonobacteraceae bacterium]
MNTINLDSCLISELTGLTTQTTNILLTDPLGSVIATFSTTAGSAALSGNQAYGPCGHLRYNAGGLSGMATSKGFSGQYSDAFSGLDYYNARYYEPAVGIFLSADSKEGNTMGMDPYMYVGGNPETYNDPTGEYYAPPPQGNGGPPPTCEQISTCWSGSGGSGHPPTGGNNPPPTRPTHQGVKLPGGCDA